MHFVSRDVTWLQSQFRVIFSEHAHTAIRDTLVIGPRSTSFTQSFVTVTAAAADDPESSKPTPYNPGHIKVSGLTGAVHFFSEAGASRHPPVLGPMPKGSQEYMYRKYSVS